MRQHLTGYRRNLVWLVWLEGNASDFYAWTGTWTLPYDGQNWVGVGGLAGISNINRGDSLKWQELQFTLPGLDPQVLAELDEDVNGRDGKVWLGALDEYNKIVPDPILLAQFKQETLDWNLEGETVTLTLNCYEALPRFDRPSAMKWSYESHSERHSGDTGFYYNTKIARSGPPVDWRPDGS